VNNVHRSCSSFILTYVCEIIWNTGLYHQAILESGSENNFWTLNYPGQQPENYVYQMAARTNCERPNDSDMIDCLRTRSATAIRLASNVACTVRSRITKYSFLKTINEMKYESIRITVIYVPCSRHIILRI